MFFCFLFLSFPTIFTLFPVFAVFGDFCSARLFCLFYLFFLFFLVRMHRTSYMHAWVVPGHPSHTPYSLVWSVAVTCPPSHLPKLCPAGLSVPLFGLFCVCWVLMHPPEPIRTHDHPPESLFTLLCLHTYMCLLGGNFPAIHGRKSYPVSLFLSLFVLFVCALVIVHPTVPIQTHMHPYTSIYTRPHPR